MGETKILAKLLRRKKVSEPYATRPKGNSFGLTAIWDIGGRQLQQKQKKGRKALVEKDSPDPVVETELGGTKPLEDEPNRNAKSPAHDQVFAELFPKGHTLGINILYAPSQPSKALVDIVLVHGLRGNSYTTWLDTRTGIYWPVQLLPHNVPNARIMAFGYDADPAGILVSGQSDIRDHAHTLLAALARERKAEPNRKLIFVVHSLGGLITKKALCMSESSAESHLNDVDRSTIAIAFLGTPHRGSGLAPFSKGIADILRLVNIKTNSVILEPLKRNSQVLADIEDSFSHWLRKKGNRIDLTCFFEELPLPFTGLVVTKDSAQIYGYPQMSIHANHRDMGKFTGPEDSGYKRVVGEIERWIDKLEVIPEISPLDKECLQSLSFPEMNDRGIDINPPAEGTCAWILNQQTYLSWLSHGQGLLWIKGKPGVGKSTLLKYILQSFQQNKQLSSDRPVTLSFFFHGRGSVLQRSPLGLFRSLLHQLLDKFPASLSNVVQTFHNRLETQGEPGENWNWRPAELQGYLEVSLPKILEETVVRIVIDALDECEVKATTGLVKFFQRLRSKCSSSRNSLHICFSSRHLPLISFENGYEICVEDENHQDIKNYIGAEIRGLGEQDEELEVLEHELITRSSYVFQWVSLVLDRALTQYNEGCSLLYILERLRDTPTELHTLYMDIVQNLLDSHDKGAESLQLIQWICFSTRPLSLTEMRFAMITDWNTYYMSREQIKSSPKFIKDDLKMEKRIKALSGGLAEIKLHDGRTRAIQFIHQSVHDYLTQEGLLTLDPFSKSIGAAIGNAHSRLSRSCIRYFSMGEIYQWMAQPGYYEDIPGGPSSYALQDGFPFLKYSLVAWGYHAKCADEKNILQDDLLYYWCWPSSQFFQTWVHVYQLVARNDPLGIPFKTPTLLHAASAYGITSLVRAILENWLKPEELTDSGDDWGQKPIFYAAQRGNESVVNLLLYMGRANPDPKDIFGTSPLAGAAACGHEGVVRLLVQNKSVDINFKDSSGGTPLSKAASQGHESIVRLLMQCEGIDLIPQDYDEMSAVSRAAQGGHENLVKLLLEHNPVDFRTHDRGALIAAASGGHDRVVKFLLENTNADVNAGEDIGTSALLSATKMGYDSTAAMLLERSDIDVNYKDGYGLSPLYYAADLGFERIVSSLLAHGGVDLTLEDDNGMTATVAAARKGFESVVKLLLGCKEVDYNSKDHEGISLLTFAAAKSWVNVMNLLLERNNTDVNSRDCNGRTALWWAAKGGYAETVKILLRIPNLVANCSDNEGSTALASASRKGHEEVVELLLPGSDVNLKDSDGMTALIWASKKGRKRVVKLLLGSRDIDINARDNSGMSALTWASRMGGEDTAGLLVQETSIDINSRDKNGMTALGWASREKNNYAVEVLLERDEIDINSKDNDGLTALAWAKEVGSECVVELLKSHGAT